MHKGKEMENKTNIQDAFGGEKVFCIKHKRALEVLWPDEEMLCEACFCEYYDQQFDEGGKDESGRSE
jgi:hypothetical protein